MSNRVQEIRLRAVPKGTEIQGIARTDRGTKYIVDSIVVLTVDADGSLKRPGIPEAIEELLARNQ